MRKLPLTLALFTILLPALPAQSPTTNESLAQEVADLKRKVAELESRLDQVLALLNQQTPAPPNPPHQASRAAKPAPASAPTTTPTPTAEPPAAQPPPPAATPESPAPAATLPQCRAILKQGNRCPHKAKPGSIYCAQHSPY